MRWLMFPLLFSLNGAFAQSPCDDTVFPTLVEGGPGVGPNTSDIGFTGATAKCWSAETYIQFTASRGAFSDAQTVHDRPSRTPLASSCTMLDGFGVPLAGCLKATGDCGPGGAGPLCSSDRLMQSGELSCVCQPQRPKLLKTLLANPYPVTGPGIDHGFFSSLFVDSDRNGSADTVAGGAVINGVRVSPVKIRRISRNLWRLNWEDLFPSSTADFNDYISSYELRECRPSRFGVDTDTGEHSCLDECGESIIPKPAWCSDGPSAVVSKMKFHVDVGFNVVRPERVGYERQGAKMEVALSVNSIFTQQALTDLMAAGSVAICPVVALRAPSWQFKRSRVGLHYGAACSHPRVGPLTGQPVCEQVTAGGLEADGILIGLGSSYMRNSFNSVFQNLCDVTRVSCSPNSPDVCNSRANSDALALGDIAVPTACNGTGTDSLVRWYEVPLSDINAALPLQLGANPQLLAYVDILVFTDIHVPQFSCPSGVDVVFRGISSSVGRVQRFRLFASTSSGVTTQFINQ